MGFDFDGHSDQELFQQVRTLRRCFTRHAAEARNWDTEAVDSALNYGRALAAAVREMERRGMLLETQKEAHCYATCDKHCPTPSCAS